MKKKPEVLTAENIANATDGMKKLIVSKPAIFQNDKSSLLYFRGGGTFIA